ncbi:MAG: class I SAM-dependent methyltransferase [Bacteroidota bacterium]
MKTWEETIKYIRTKPEYSNLVEKAYLNEDLVKNVESFRNSREFLETKKLLKSCNTPIKKLLDIGCGNGISSISFALEGYDVTAVEPDGSSTVGAGAIRILKNHYKLDNITIFESYAEDIKFENETFDLVYFRQAMHHANELEKFIAESARVLKKNGLLLSIRDHVIFNEEDKKQFLKTHPLQEFYGGENAYTANEYEEAMAKSGLKIVKKIKTFDSVINYFPMDEKFIQKILLKKRLAEIIISLTPSFINEKIKLKIQNLLNEKDFDGRMYSYLCRK